MRTMQIDQMIGHTLGEYRIERLLGSGKLTAVYMAQHVREQRPAMITVFLVPDEFSAQARARFVTRFVREGERLLRLKHQHILPIYAVGEHDGSPYLITAFVKENSLASMFQSLPSFTPKQTLILLKQIASALEHAHMLGVTHGSLTPSTILLSETQGVLIAGFGFASLLEMRGVEQSTQPYAHLLNIVGTPLCPPAYIAPEWLQGAPLNTKMDVYALGVLLYQLLTGSLPFPQIQSLETAIQYMGLPLPSLASVNANVPAALDLVVQQAMERIPAQRFQSAEEVARAFERIIMVVQGAAKPVAAGEMQQDTQVTLPPTVNWFDDEMLTLTGKQRTLSTSSMKMAGVSATEQDASKKGSGWQLLPPVVTSQMPAIKREDVTGNLPAVNNEHVASVDPFVWWSTVALGQGEGQMPGTFTARASATPVARPRAKRKPTLQDRRRTIALLAGGGVVAAGVLGITGISLAHMLNQNNNMATTTGTSQQASVPTAASTQSTVTSGQATPTAKPTQKPTAKSTPTSQPTQQPTSQPTQGTGQAGQPTPTPQPTQPPTPTPTPPPQHTGTVIGNTSMATNSAQNFTNPANGRQCVLVHLPNGNFVAYDKACTHQGVQVYYNGGSHMLDCPAHGAVFNPASGGQPVSGPNNGPLAGVSIRVNPDGTITTG